MWETAKHSNIIKYGEQFTFFKCERGRHPAKWLQTYNHSLKEVFYKNVDSVCLRVIRLIGMRLTTCKLKPATHIQNAGNQFTAMYEKPRQLITHILPTILLISKSSKKPGGLVGSCRFFMLIFLHPFVDSIFDTGHYTGNRFLQNIGKHMPECMSS